jgi:hypothetical protein
MTCKIFNFGCGENDSYPNTRFYHMYLTWSVIEFELATLDIAL